MTISAPCFSGTLKAICTTNVLAGICIQTEVESVALGSPGCTENGNIIDT